NGDLKKDHYTENNLFPHCVFYQCDKLESIILPKDIHAVGNACLRECPNLREVIMAHSLFTRMHNNAFRASKKITSFSLPASVTEIDNDVFVNTEANTGFHVSNANTVFTTINGVLFTKDKKELVAFPVGYNALEYTVPFGTETIRSCAFSYTKLHSLKMPYGLRIIDKWAFEYSSFKNLTLPSTVKEIKGAVFLNCKSIENLYLHNPEPPKIDAAEQGIIQTKCLLHVPYKKMDAYKAADYWKNFNNNIRELSNVIYVYKPGYKLEFTLADMGIKPDTLKSVMIHGELDSDDIKYLRMLAGVDDTGEESSMNILKDINLGEARIIDGGSAYLIKDGIEYVSSANDMGQYAFANTNIETFRFPASIDTVHLNTFENSTDLNCIAFNSLPSNITDATEAKQLLPESQENGIIVINNHTGESGTANVIISNDQTSFVKLIDKKNYALNEKLSLASCSFTKVFSKETKKNESKGWETLILPFKPTEIRGFNKRKAEVFLVPFGSDRTPFEDKGLRVLNFWLHELTPEGFKAVKFEDMKAYTPYIISMPNNSDDYGDTYNIEGPVEFIANAVGNTKVELNETILPETTTGNQFDMSATFRKMTGNADVYVLNKEGSSFDIITSFDDRTAEDYRVDAFEAYVIAHPAFKGTKSFRIDGRPSIPSDIEQIMMNTDENKKELQIMTDPNGLRIRSKSDRSLQVYTIDGRIATDVYLYEGDNYISLPKGIYVIEREKAVVY
ncbi:MAG: leucine-rich repeat protein, partial [Anaerovorax sp.]